jgi:predicted dehydrogenase
MEISVIGGGRWARTIASVLSALPGRADRITLHSRSNFAGLKAWVEQPQFAGRLQVVDVWPASRADGGRPDAVIIANRVGQHFEAAANALSEGIMVLAEKPVSVSLREIEELSEIATARGTILAASHVLLFARYFLAYAEAVARLGEGRNLRFVWTDGTADVIRNETKSYDAAVTVFDDVLPHILPMIARLQFGDCTLGSINVARGGAQLEINLRSAGRPVSLLVARNNEDGRRRRIEVDTDNGVATLDFATEPGVIEISGNRTNGDPQWDGAPRPLATMLTAFIATVEGVPLDPRLSPALAVSTAALAGAIRGQYIAHQAEWLRQRIGEPLDPTLRYALTELRAEEHRSDEAISSVWSAIKDRTGLEQFLSKTGFGQDK